MKEDLIQKYKNLRFSGGAMNYGFDGQAARQAVPQSIPGNTPDIGPDAVPEIQYRPMPSAVLFDEEAPVKRRNRYKLERTAKAAFVLLGVLVSFLFLGLTLNLYGELNEEQIKVNELMSEIKALEEKEGQLQMCVYEQMTEFEMLDYARKTLKMKEGTYKNTVILDPAPESVFELQEDIQEELSVIGFLHGELDAFLSRIRGR